MLRGVVLRAGTVALIIAGTFAVVTPAVGDDVSSAAAEDIKIVEVQTSDPAYVELQNTGTSVFSFTAADNWELYKCNADVSLPAAEKVADLDGKPPEAAAGPAIRR